MSRIILLLNSEKEKKSVVQLIVTLIMLLITAVLALLFLCADKGYPPSCTTLHCQTASDNRSSQTTKMPLDRVSLPHLAYADKSLLNRILERAMATNENAQPKSD